MIASKLSLLPRALAGAALLASASFSLNAFAAPFVLAYTDGQLPQSYTNLQAYYGNLSAVGLGSTYALLVSGKVDSGALTTTTSNIISFANTKGLPVYPTVSDYSNAKVADKKPGFDPAVSNAVLKSEASRANAIANLLALATTKSVGGVNVEFAGINIDLEAVRPGLKVEMTAFIGSLATALHQHGKKLIISVPAKSSDVEPEYLGGYDYAQIGAAVDYFQVMTYDEVGPGWSSSSSATWPGPEAGLDWMAAKLSYAVSVVPAAKVLQGLPAYGFDYSTGKQVNWKGSNGVAGYDDIIAAHSARKLRDTASATPYATWGTVKPQPDGTAWTKTNKQPVLWYDDAQSITAKAALVGTYQLGGTSVWAMGFEDGNFWSAVSAGLRATGGSIPTNPAAGTGYVWRANAGATDNANRVAAPAVNDRDLAASLVLNADGEGGAQKWQAAGIVFPAATALSSVTFTNGAIDQNGNGYFESGLSLQVSTNGSTWQESGWKVSPSYPNSEAAASQAYTFTGTQLNGIVGARVVGRTGASSWSGAVKEVQVQGAVSR